jgi:glycosyltransferase involved in cell wall biosynthesis
MPTVSVDIIIPTLNEAYHIKAAVENAQQLGNVFVLDSLSTDGTQEIARQAGATVIEHEFLDYASQKNWGLDNLPLTAEWTFILDADERITPALVAEIERRTAATPNVNGYYVNRQLIWLGRRIRHGGLFPSWNLRLFRRGMARYENRKVHEHMICRGPTDYLNNAMLHIRIETVDEFIKKHIRYADLESDEWVRAYFQPHTQVPARELFRDYLRVRQWLRRQVWPRVPCRPLLRFVYMFLFRFGIMDGRPGWYMAWLMANYEFMISLLYKDKLLSRLHPENVPSGLSDSRL